MKSALSVSNTSLPVYQVSVPCPSPNPFTHGPSHEIVSPGTGFASHIWQPVLGSRVQRASSACAAPIPLVKTAAIARSIRMRIGDAENYSNTVAQWSAARVAQLYQLTRAIAQRTSLIHLNTFELTSGDWAHPVRRIPAS